MENEELGVEKEVRGGGGGGEEEKQMKWMRRGLHGRQCGHGKVTGEDFPGRRGWFVQKRGGETPESREGDKEQQRL